jgi:hypothetical protein
VNSTKNINLDLLIDDFTVLFVNLRAFALSSLARNGTARANQITVGARVASLDMVSGPKCKATR